MFSGVAGIHLVSFNSGVAGSSVEMTLFCDCIS